MSEGDVSEDGVSSSVLTDEIIADLVRKNFILNLTVESQSKALKEMEGELERIQVEYNKSLPMSYFENFVRQRLLDGRIPLPPAFKKENKPVSVQSCVASVNYKVVVVVACISVGDVEQRPLMFSFTVCPDHATAERFYKGFTEMSWVSKPKSARKKGVGQPVAKKTE